MKHKYSGSIWGVIKSDINKFLIDNSLLFQTNIDNLWNEKTETIDLRKIRFHSSVSSKRRKKIKNFITSKLLAYRGKTKLVRIFQKSKRS